MCPLASHQIDLLRSSRHVAAQLAKVVDQFTPRFAAQPQLLEYRWRVPRRAALQARGTCRRARRAEGQDGGEPGGT